MGAKAAKFNCDCLIRAHTGEGDHKGRDINEDEGERGGESVGGD